MFAGTLVCAPTRHMRHTNLRSIKLFVSKPGRPVRVAVAAAAAFMFTASAVSAAPGVEPAAVDKSVNPGASFDVAKVVGTSPLPPKPDIVMLIDTTGSMGEEIANVQAKLAAAITEIKAAQPDAQGAVVSYKDESDGAGLFEVRQDLTGSEAALQAAVDGLSASGGGDLPEAWGYALWRVSTGAITYRPDSSRIVVLVGDAPTHDPSNGHTLADAVTELQADNARVVAVDVSGLDADGGTPDSPAGQATLVTSATGGVIVPAGGDVTGAILAGLKNLDATVTHEATCDTGLSVTFDAASRTVPSGSDANFVETFTVGADALQGGTLKCTVKFLVNGTDAGPAFVQSVTVHVNDVTPPTGGCVLGPNPGGKVVPPAEAGFRTLTATDNVDTAVDIYVKDSGSSAVFGPYPSGTDIKVTQAPGATPSAVPGEGAVEWHITLNGDPVLDLVDDANNRATVVCPPVPPKKK